MSRADTARLRDILERVAAARRAEILLETAERDADPDLEAAAFDAILYDLVVIGEAVKALPSALTARRPDVPWRSIAGMRDVLAHHYFSVRASVVRGTLDEPLARLQEAAEELLLAANGDDA